MARMRSVRSAAISQSNSLPGCLTLRTKYVCLAPSSSPLPSPSPTASICARRTVMWFALKVAAMALMSIGTSLTKLMKMAVQLWCRSLLKPISSPTWTGLLPTSVMSGLSELVRLKSLLHFMRFASWCLKQNITASLTVGKNHWSPMNVFKPAFRKVLSTRLPTMANAIWMPRWRAVLTTSWRTWMAVESRLTTGVISKTIYSVRFTASRSVT
mmetsp:Transcript_26943/g.78194  ORF Transcript_26943/g.78194 Transcript_26943/m.78194 type:complete len:213 (+) Transcript_26943:607-1245(+)